MKRRERIETVRKLFWSDRGMSLEQIAQVCQVSVRTIYRDLHAMIENHNHHQGSMAISR